MNEEWRPVFGLEDLYLVSNLGRIWSILRDKERKAFLTNRGYLTLQMPNKGRTGFETRSVHSIVAEAFIRPRRGNEQVNHKDLDKTNNRLENLEWCSNLENIRHYLSSDKCKAKPKRRNGPPQSGEQNRNARLQVADIVAIRRAVSEGATQSSLAALYGISQSMVHAIKTRARWGSVP